ncbi:hypothetical protein Pcinc_041105 [Petrolisthes cinctipes]|uniref:Uncharacterized protein n=1 Tax=Petrolisthes cinctipes TaxID=88211 RepID=A0AAE1BKW2_PETCI|nr:hypothetical protein Pcinc_041105 [Petrolisthes cinctipes]
METDGKVKVKRNEKKRYETKRLKANHMREMEARECERGASRGGEQMEPRHTLTGADAVRKRGKQTEQKMVN